MSRNLFIYAAICVGFLANFPASAEIVNATNPGSLPATAQDVTNTFATGIDGNLLGATAVNVFEIDILDPLAFSATTVPLISGVPDTKLFLFDGTGHAVYENDDITGANTLSCLPSAIASNPCGFSGNGLGPFTAGNYFLAITRSDEAPWDSLNNYLFNEAADSTAVNGPDFSAGGANPIAGWDDGVYTAPNYDLTAYEIDLTGTSPEPSTGWLMAGAGAVLFGLRRRLSPRKA
ncbi:MAG TPA: PEP-CTERM sorting domain-containing protein [Bryobacteraceae bacterium]